jgi:galactokinase
MNAGGEPVNDGEGNDDVARDDRDASDSMTAFFESEFGRAPAGVWAAPGRVNLIGEHTDYNDGFVLPFGLQHRCLAAAGPATTGLSRVVSAQRRGEVHSFSAASVVPGEVDGWAAYVAGVLWALRENGHAVGELDIVVDSDVPLGAGLSSSAAIECAVGLACSDLFELHLGRTPLALIGRSAENDFVGAATGVMDQMASVYARAGHLVFLDTRDLQIELVPFDLPSEGLALLVVDTKAPHALVDGQYASRRASCEEAARQLDVAALRDIALPDLDAALARLDDDVLRRRVRHVVTEDARVGEVVRHLRAGGDPRGIGEAMTASHASLRDDYEVTVPHLDVAVEAALGAGAWGARMTGGGFGGSVIALCDEGRVQEAVAAVEQAYASRGFGAPTTFCAVPSEGAHRLR